MLLFALHWRLRLPIWLCDWWELVVRRRDRTMSDEWIATWRTHERALLYREEQEKNG